MTEICDSTFDGGYHTKLVLSARSLRMSKTSVSVLYCNLNLILGAGFLRFLKSVLIKSRLLWAAIVIGEVHFHGIFQIFLAH